MLDQYKEAVGEVCQGLFGQTAPVELTRTDETHGDFATNVALQLAGRLGKNPRELAEQIVAKLHEQQPELGLEVAGPGFINLRLPDQAVWQSMHSALEFSKPLVGKTVVAEYSDPNPFKVLHAGHLYTSVVGDAIANLLEVGGASVRRVNFGGDVGLHVGKTMWAILQKLGGENPEKLNEVPESKRAEWLAEAYIAGTNAYENIAEARPEIVALNKRVYRLHADQDKSSPFSQIYWATRQWSYDYFNQFYRQIGTQFEKYYPESETVDIGLTTVREHIGDVFEESDGAVIFNGEKFGLHTRVFINSEGLPTYEAKDVGLSLKKYEDYHFDRSVIITGNEQLQYMAVVQKAIEQFRPELAQATTHLTHGIVKLAGGVKMSSRKGNILRAVDILNSAEDAQRLTQGTADAKIVLAAVKYSFLKNRLGGDIIYDPAESVSLEGNSGPYLQYALVRARSILAKAGEIKPTDTTVSLEAGERSLASQVSKYPEVFEKALTELAPHHICSYLYETAQVFNRFYENNKVVGNERASLRVSLVKAYTGVLEHGLKLLGIPTPERM
jgi:arginyl-tRNA synthetase